MFLVDKYYNDSNYITCHQTIIDKIIDSFDAHNQIYSNVNSIIKMPNDEFKKIIDDLEYGTWRYSNFQHLIVYGPVGSGKEYLINKLLEKIYGKQGVELKEVEYTVSGYSNTKTKIMIKQSKHHIIIEPNSNGFDKYLIQEIIQDYAKSELLNILKNRKIISSVKRNNLFPENLFPNNEKFNCEIEKNENSLINSDNVNDNEKNNKIEKYFKFNMHFHT